VPAAKAPAVRLRDLLLPNAGMARRRDIIRRCLSKAGALVLTAAALMWRSLMFRTTVIAITGSVGKSTAKECLAGILSAQAGTVKTLHNQNDTTGVPRTILAMRPWHRYAVIEVAAGVPGQMRRSARLVRPNIAVVLGLARTHTNVFPTLEDTAAEKARLLEHLRPGGTAILNGDDIRIRRMTEKVRGRVLLFGLGRDCDVAAENVRAAWPERLDFTVRSGTRRSVIQTQLVGTHWIHSVLASLAAACVCGVPISDAAAALADVAPFAGRMQPVELPIGATVIRDEENGSPDTLEAMFRVVGESECGRKILVFSDISDSTAKPRRRQREVGRRIAGLVDAALFVGEHGHHAVRGAVGAGMDPVTCHAVIDLAEAAEWLKRELRANDLVFLKGRTTDHLSRIVFAQVGAIGCWTVSCRIKSLCDLCPKLHPEFDLRRALKIGRPHP